MTLGLRWSECNEFVCANDMNLYIDIELYGFNISHKIYIGNLSPNAEEMDQKYYCLGHEGSKVSLHEQVSTMIEII